MNTHDLEEEVAASVQRVEGRVGLELQWSLYEHEDDHTEWMLALHVVVERAGEHHSRYSTVEIVTMKAEKPDARRETHDLAARIATVVGLPMLHTPRVEDLGGQGGSAWIRAQPPGPPHPYELRWEATWWTEAGELERGEGVDIVHATSGSDADMQLARMLKQRIAGRPMQATMRGGTRYGHTSEPGWWPGGVLDDEHVRAVALESDCRASAIARALVAGTPSLSAIDLMVVFKHCFRTSLERLTPLARWKAGALDDTALDAAVPQIAENRHDWDRVRRLRTGHAAGHSLAAAIREELRTSYNWVPVVVDVKTAFGLGLNDAKVLVDDARDPRRDADVDARVSR